MDSQEVEIVVKTCEHSIDFILGQVATSGGKFVWSILHKFGESIFFETQSQGGHLSNNIASIDHVISPSVHNSAPFREIEWGLVGDGIDWIADVPEVPPFGVEWWRVWSVGLIFRSVAFSKVFVSPGLFGVFGSSTDLEIVVRVYIGDDSSAVEISSSFGEVFFHHVEELGVLLLVDSGVFDDEAAVLLESLGHSFTVLSGSLTFEERFNIDDRNLQI